MKLLVIGGGGREHALAWKLASSPRVQKVFVAPGNGGTASDKRFSNVPYASNEALAQFARDEAIAFAVVGPEAALASGVVDVFRARGLRIFGPTRAAAQIESSKDFAKALMRRHGIPTADYRTFDDASEARAYVTERGAPIVIKADGLAAGKGVVVAMTLQEAHAAIDATLTGTAVRASSSKNFSKARKQVSSCFPMARTFLHWRRARITSGCWTTIVARIPAVWVRIHRRRS